MEPKPPPTPDCTPLDGAWRPLLDELLFDEPLFDPDDEPPDEPVDPVELEPEPEFEAAPPDEPELDEVPPVPVVAAWVVPGSTTATIPATATLASDTVTVVAFSRRRPCSRWATARAT